MTINKLVFNLTSSFVQSSRIKCAPRSRSKRRETRVPIAVHTKRPKSCGEIQRVEAPSDVKLSSSSTLPFADGLEPYSLPRRKSSRCNPPLGNASMSANLSRSLPDRRPSKLSQGDFPNNGQSESVSQRGTAQHFVAKTMVTEVAFPQGASTSDKNYQPSASSPRGKGRSDRHWMAKVVFK